MMKMDLNKAKTNTHRRIILSLLVLCIFGNVQSNVAKIPPILQKLASLKSSPAIVYLQPINWIELNDLPKNYRNEAQHIVKTSQGLFLTIPGTGRLYKCLIKKDHVDFIRIDSTFFGGHNFNSMSFSMNDTVFSFGGEGFWHTNGNLRYYNPEFHEWYAIPLDRNIQKNFPQKNLASYFFFLNTSNNTITMDGSPTSPFYLKKPFEDSIFKDKLFQLDLSSGNWIELGKKNFESQLILASTNLGVFTKYNFIDIIHNKVYKHNLINTISQIFGKASEEEFVISFCFDSTVYLGSRKRIDSFSLRGLLLTDTKELAFIPNQGKSSFSIFYWIGAFLLTGITAFVVYFFGKFNLHFQKIKSVQHKLKDVEIYPNIQSIPSAEKIGNAFNPHELDFLKFIYDHTQSNNSVNIDEINRNLGIQNKSIEIQKKTRRDMINTINEKWCVAMNTDKYIIDKNRSAFDKRSYDYFIHADFLAILKKHFS